MKIKKYVQFIMESSGYQWGCVMVQVPIKNWQQIISQIQPEDVYDGGDDRHGIEDDPHLTLLYGLEPQITEEEIKKVFSDFEHEVTLKINGIDTFNNEEYDVVKLNVEKTPELQKLHDRLSELPNHDSYPEYRPHITISYVKKGTGNKYVNPDFKMDIQGLNTICYSQPSGKRTYFEL